MLFALLTPAPQCLFQSDGLLDRLRQNVLSQTSTEAGIQKLMKKKAVLKEDGNELASVSEQCATPKPMCQDVHGKEL